MHAALRERRSDIADVSEFMSLTGVRWGEVRAIRVGWLSEMPLPQLHVERSHSDRYEEKAPKSWRGTSDAARAATYQDWIHHYNHHRPHTGIGGQTPSARVHNLRGKNS